MPLRTMTPQILRLNELRAADAATAGGKAANLGELAALGLPVPPGFVVTAIAFRELCGRIASRWELARLAAVDDGFATRCGELQQRCLDTPMPAPLAAAIRDAHELLMDGRPDQVCAVRSSAIGEDGAGSSFAGQHGTYYHVDAARLHEMVRRCWASVWSPEAVAYRNSRGLAHEDVAMAVLVQVLVRADVAGVTFTVNPVTGRRDELVIESSWGLGAALVDGRVTPDRYILARDDLAVRNRRIADKRHMVRSYLDDAVGGRLADVPLDLRTHPTLEPERVRDVATLALRCDHHFGEPQDVEWAVAGERLWLLQSRPVTAAGARPAEPVPEGAFVLFKPVVENFTGPLSPLMVDLLPRGFEPALRVIGGRLYVDLRYARMLLPLDLSDRELAELLYSMFAVMPARPRIAARRLPAVMAAAGIGYLAAAVTLIRTTDLPDDAMEPFRTLCREVADDPAAGPIEALQRLALNATLFAPIGRLPILVNLGSLRYFFWTALLRALLHRWAPLLDRDAAAGLCLGGVGVKSADMGRHVAQLAQHARRDAAVAAVIANSAPEDMLAELRALPAARQFLDALDGFLAMHGHRALKEFELEAPRWHEDPAPVLAMVRNHVLASADDPDAASGKHDDGSRALDDGSRALDVRARTEAALRHELDKLPLERPLHWRWRLADFAAGRARYYQKLRENSRFYHIMAIDGVRRKILDVEAELLRDGRLRCRGDIFFLRWPEIDELRHARIGWTDVEDRIRDRRIEHVRRASTNPPRTFGIPADDAPPGGSDADVAGLNGQAASPGRYVGRARVITDPARNAALLPGEVLVAPYTDPAWTPLFLTAGAAVIEVGSYLSHAGTVAREYGMPCVVDVGGCTTLIRNGDVVEVDGDSGAVRILDTAAVP